MSGLKEESSPPILGIDPGLASLGWGVIERRGGRLIHREHGVIKTTNRLSFTQRLLLLVDELDEIVSQYSPLMCGIETLYFGKNTSSAIPVAQARGAVVYSLAKRKILVEDFDPVVIKKSVCGVGNAQKEQVQAMVKLLLGLGEIPKPDHAADALAVAICVANQSVGLASTQSIFKDRL